MHFHFIFSLPPLSFLLSFFISPLSLPPSLFLFPLSPPLSFPLSFSSLFFLFPPPPPPLSLLGGGFTSKRGIFGKLGKPITMLCAAYGTTDESCYTGGADGKVYHWTKTNVSRVIEFHRGPVFVIQPVEKVNTNINN